MDQERYWSEVRALRLRIADLLDSLTPQEWDAPSLCAGWKVRDVAGHLSIVSTITTPQLLRAMPRSGFNLNRVNTAIATKYGAEHPSTIIGRIRESAELRTTARVLDTRDALFDSAVHSQDIAVPLGRDFTVPVEAVVAGLTRVWSMGWPFRAARRLEHLALRATDADWSAGHGSERVEGPALALLLLLTGRTDTARRDLTGAGLARLPG